MAGADKSGGQEGGPRQGWPASCTQHSDSGPRLGPIDNSDPSARRTSAMMTDDDRKGHNSIWDSIKSGARTFQTADDTSSDGVDGD